MCSISAVYAAKPTNQEKIIRNTPEQSFKVGKQVQKNKTRRGNSKDENNLIASIHFALNLISSCMLDQSCSSCVQLMSGHLNTFQNTCIQSLSFINRFNADLTFCGFQSGIELCMELCCQLLDVFMLDRNFLSFPVCGQIE